MTESLLAGPVEARTGAGVSSHSAERASVGEYADAPQSETGRRGSERALRSPLGILDLSPRARVLSLLRTDVPSEGWISSHLRRVIRSHRFASSVAAASPQALAGGLPFTNAGNRQPSPVPSTRPGATLRVCASRTPCSSSERRKAAVRAFGWDRGSTARAGCDRGTRRPAAGTTARSRERER